MNEAAPIINYCAYCGRTIRAGDYFWATSRGPYCSTECMDQADTATPRKD